MIGPRTILALSPHPDDTDLGCGATLARMREDGSSVHVVALSECRASIPSGYPVRAIASEFRNATAVMGVASSTVADFDVRTFPESRQSILEYLRGLADTICPDLVLVPSLSDRHQDHHQTTLEAIRAFQCSIWGYHLAWNVRNPRLDVFIPVEERHVGVKLSALSCYESQVAKRRPYMDPDIVKAIMMTWGVQCGSRYAEAFECIRLVV
jgi:LmbE family N-acetylglucosaminyl deacetylase